MSAGLAVPRTRRGCALANQAGWAVGVARASSDPTNPRGEWERGSRSRARAETEATSRRATSAAPRVGAAAAPAPRDRDPRTHARHLAIKPPAPHTAPFHHCLPIVPAQQQPQLAKPPSPLPWLRCSLGAPPALAMASRAAMLLLAVAAVLVAAASAQEMDTGVPPAPAPVTGAAAGTAASALAVACSAVFSILVAGGLVQ
ncbi:hypothetical protein EJB05_50611, partial [Eragrostis curvula]